MITLASAVLASSCGYNPDRPAYDTTLNPDGYPIAALKLIDRIDNGQLVEFDSITAAFGDLYTTNAELLDDPRWLAVVERIGAKFRSQADRWVKEGIPSYLKAARYYSLAALARPGDDRLRERHQLFAVWEHAVTDSIVAPNFDPQKSAFDLRGRLALLKYFMLGDSLHRDFAQDYIIPQLFGGRAPDRVLNPSLTRDLSIADKCFLEMLGAKHEPFESRIAAFTEPRIDLVAAQIVHQHDDWYAAELYFVPQESLKVNYTVALEIPTSGSQKEPATALSRALAFDFHPDLPTSHWRANQMAAAYRRFRYIGPAQPVLVGLYDDRPDSTRYVRVQESGEPLFTLPVTVFVAR
ncbi:MAG TPA: hypothetical protein VMS71_01845 [Candidatus Acidoferrum sp.]|nr:hypothetical protein [Candidatus Acidoferrum sp.]